MNKFLSNTTIIHSQDFDKVILTFKNSNGELEHTEFEAADNGIIDTPMVDDSQIVDSIVNLCELDKKQHRGSTQTVEPVVGAHLNDDEFT